MAAQGTGGGNKGERGGGPTFEGGVSKKGTGGGEKAPSKDNRREHDMNSFCGAGRAYFTQHYNKKEEKGRERR